MFLVTPCNRVALDTPISLFFKCNVMVHSLIIYWKSLLKAQLKIWNAWMFFFCFCKAGWFQCSKVFYITPDHGSYLLSKDKYLLNPSMRSYFTTKPLNFNWRLLNFIPVILQRIFTFIIPQQMRSIFFMQVSS